MSEFATKQFIAQAQQSLRGGRPGEALEFAQQASSLDPSNGEALMLCGIALSQLNRPLEAEEAFAKAASLDPENPKVLYNWAVHRYSVGNRQGALEKARKALDIDPSHASARDLVIRLESELGLRAAQEPGEPLRSPAAAAPTAAEQPPAPPRHYYTPYEPPLHSLQFVERLGPAWDTLGWGFLGLRLLTLLISVVQAGRALSAASEDPNAVLENLTNNPMYYQGVAESLVGVLSLMLSLAILGWLVFDILDRRASWLWLVPYFLFCCCTCTYLDWIIMPLYVFIGRPKLKP